MSTGDVSEFRRKIEAMSAAYRASLPATLAALAAGWRSLETGAPGAPTASELRLSAHSIAGSAGSFGLPEVGERARELEWFIKELQTRGGLVQPEDGERFRALLDALERAIPSQS
jgi:HPt (histidine-containing phosphotransfer) domain-containing protein